jgi:predicted TIM-barrel fold metal-dependent hydrolase
MIIDIHTHICNKKIWKEYQEKSHNTIEKVIAIPWCNRDSNDTPRIPDVEELLEFTASESNVFALGSIDMDGNLEAQLARHEELLQQGKIVGIKLYTGYQYFYPYDEGVVRIGNLCGKYGKPLVFHIGDCFDPDDKAILKYAHPIHIDELAKLCPNTNIVISHLGFPYFLETGNVVASNDNVYADISAVMVEFDTFEETMRLQEQYSDDLRRIFTYFPIIKNRIMFGTDFAGNETSLNLVQPYVELLKTSLNKEQQENAFCKLAERLYFK